MAKKVIKIEGYIGGWGYGKGLLRLDLADTQKEGVVLEISSLGGSLFDAIDMYNQIAQHGNVEIVYTGPSASAATILAMSAKKVSIIDTSFILIHKVMTTVDNFGTFNEDELDTLIKDLQQLRTENQKFDQVIARIYQRKTGQPVDEILSLMKNETWISAQEAKELGFVDEVIEPSAKYNSVMMNDRFVAMVHEAELPEIPAVAQPQPAIHANQNSNDMRQFTHVNQLLEVDELMISDEGCYLNEDQLSIIDSRIEGLLQCEHNYADVISERDLARTSHENSLSEISTLTDVNQHNEQNIIQLGEEKVGLEKKLNNSVSEYQALITLLNSLDESVVSVETADAKIEQVRSLLSKVPGAPVPGILNKHDDPGKPKDNVNWEVINKLPHNIELDRNL